MEHNFKDLLHKIVVKAAGYKEQMPSFTTRFKDMTEIKIRHNFAAPLCYRDCTHTSIFGYTRILGDYGFCRINFVVVDSNGEYLVYFFPYGKYEDAFLDSSIGLGKCCYFEVEEWQLNDCIQALESKGNYLTLYNKRL